MSSNKRAFAGGSGTAEDPWLLAAAEHLDNLRLYLGDPLTMAVISVSGVENDPGDYVFEIPPGTHSYLISKYCYI